MAVGSSNSSFAKDIRTLFEIGVLANLSDGQLLERFVDARTGNEASEAVFAEIVRRHGPMVHRVCRDILKNPHDTQDAVQATFVVLIRKADSVRSRESIASWLYGTATRVARRASTDAANRRPRERLVAVPEVIEPVHDEGWSELHEELARLPEKYRVPLVLCYLEGMTTEAAARQLGCPQGTVLCRLSRGRERLRSRLVRRGLTASSALLALGRFSEARAVAMPAGLVGSTVRAALRFAADGSAAIGAGVVSARGLALAEGTLRTMLMTKIKLLGVLLLAGGTLAVVVPMTQSTKAQQPPPAQDQSRPEARKPKPKVDDRWVKKLPSGAVVELVGISNQPSGPTKWWTPGGKPLSVAPYASGGASTNARTNEQAREFAVRLKEIPNQPMDVKWKFSPSGSFSVGNPVDQAGRIIPGMKMIAMTLPGNLAECVIEFGVAAGPWKVEASCGPGGEAAMGFEKIGIIFGRSYEIGGHSVIAVSHNTLNEAVRVVAIDVEGKEHTPGSTSYLSTRDIAQQTLEFPLALKSIKEFQFQTRPYEWAEFKDVPLQPPAAPK